MTAKKKKPEYDLLGKVTMYPYGDKTPVPEGTTYVEHELDYSGCCYEGEHPSIILLFYKEKP